MTSLRTMTTPREIDVEALLEHQGFLRRLARSLVPEDRVDDVVQETWLRAFEQPPRGSMRGWLARIAQNFARDVRAREGERRAREERAAKIEATEGGDEVQVALELQHHVGGVLERLREPYRSTLFLRYWHELGPREIAAREGLPIDTVKTRLRRGLELMRDELDRHYGDRSAWCALFLPFTAVNAAEVAGPWTGPIGATFVNVQLKLVLATVVAVGGLTALWPLVRNTEPETDSVVAALGSEPESVEATDATVAATETPAQRSDRSHVAPVSSSSEVAAVTEPEPLLVVRGRVLDCAGVAKPGVRVGLAGTDGVASEAGGFFELPVERVGGRIVALDPNLATVLPGACRTGSIEPVVVVAPKLRVAGVVTDEGGAPLLDARIRLVLPNGFGARFATRLDATVQDLPHDRTAADGRFVLDPLPRVAGALLQTTLEGRVQDVRPAPEFSDSDLRIVLERHEVAEQSVHGVVLDLAGRPVPAAHVAIGAISAVSDAAGEFQLNPDTWNVEAAIVAVKPGHLPGRVEREFDVNGEPVAWPDWIELRLGSPPLELAGRVVDAGGAGVEGARVWLGDATLFGYVRDNATNLEHVLSGSATVDGFVLDRPNALWDWTETDERGRFRLSGLLDRDYRIVAMGPDSLLAVEGGPFAPGRDDVELNLGEAPRYERLAGRVISPTGEPIAGVQVSLNRTVARISIQKYAEGSSVRSRSSPGAKLVTGSNGRFEFVDVPAWGRCFASFDGEHVIANWVELEGLDETEGLDVTVQRRCNFRLELAADNRADRVEVRDAQGQAMTLYILRHESSYEDVNADVVDGRTDVLAVGEAAATLVLMRDGEVVESAPLALSPGDVNVIRL